jgi:hypothetical protein
MAVIWSLPTLPLPASSARALVSRVALTSKSPRAEGASWERLGCDARLEAIALVAIPTTVAIPTAVATAIATAIPTTVLPAIPATIAIAVALAA